MDTQGNSRLRGHRDQSPHPLDQLKDIAKENCCYHLKNWCGEMYDDLKDMGKSLKNAFRPEEVQQNREMNVTQFLNSNGRNPRDHTFRVFHPEPQMVVG